MDASSQFQDTLPITSDAMLERLDAAEVDYTLFTHVPLRTVEDAKLVQNALGEPRPDDFHIKNLYLRDKKKRNFLVVLEQDYVLDLKGLGPLIGAGKLSFGSADRLLETLGVRPGAVTPLTMIRGVEHHVSLWLDPAIRAAGRIFMHPLVNDRTVAMTPAEMLRFLEASGVVPNWLPPSSE